MRKTKLLTALVAATVLSSAAVTAVQAGLFDRQEKTETQATPQAPLPSQQVQAPMGTPLSFADLAEHLLPTVVNISSTVQTETAPGLEEILPHFPEDSPFGDFFERFLERHGRGAPSMPMSSLGSGFVIDAKKGYVVTNSHVVKDAVEVRVTLHDDQAVDAEIIGRDEKTDLAVLKIDPKDLKLKAVAFGDSNQMRVGDWVLAIGNPFGLGGTVTSGIISARARDINSGPYDDFIQTDASINRGNSGGPMFNLKGEVIGVNTAIFSPTGGSVGIGFAIPSAMVKTVVDQLVEFGHTRRGWLGVRIQTVTEAIAESLGLKATTGALVASVNANSPAADAKIMPGDVIVSFNGQEIDEMRTLPRIVAETKIKSVVDVIVFRDGKEKRLKVKIGELEKAEKNGMIVGSNTEDEESVNPGTDLEALDLRVAPLNTVLRRNYGIEADVSGVLVVDIGQDSEALKKGLNVGDVISEINQVPVKSVADVQKAIEGAKKQKRASVLLLAHRNNDVRFVAVKLADPKKDAPKDVD